MFSEKTSPYEEIIFASREIFHKYATNRSTKSSALKSQQNIIISQRNEKIKAEVEAKEIVEKKPQKSKMKKNRPKISGRRK